MKVLGRTKRAYFNTARHPFEMFIDVDQTALDFMNKIGEDMRVQI
jgi:hypothetical protein